MSVSGTTHSFFMDDHWSANIAAAHPARDGATGKELGAFAEDEPSFWDFLDVINPLQHIPIVNTLYREISGDQIGVAARLAGGTLLGGPIGLAAAAVNTMIEHETGMDAGGHLLAMFRGGDEAPDEPTMLAEGPQPEAQPQTQAQVQTQAQAGDVPSGVLAAPEPGRVRSANAVMFNADGPVVAAASPAPVPSPAPAPRPLPLAEAQPARFMPMPPRPSEANMRPLPQRITVPVSNNGARSSVPPTGRDPVSAMPNSAAVQRMLEAQGLTESQHPLLPGQGGDQAWFAASMNTGLNKYEQASRLTDATSPANVLIQ